MKAALPLAKMPRTASYHLSKTGLCFWQVVIDWIEEEIAMITLKPGTNLLPTEDVIVILVWSSLSYDTYVANDT